MAQEKRKIIHDINNILTTLSLSAELFLDGAYGAVTKEQKKHISDMLSSCKEIQKLLKDLAPNS